jgi:hypothetical protein
VAAFRRLLAHRRILHWLAIAAPSARLHRPQ